jgi:hypothetical protein
MKLLNAAWLLGKWNLVSFRLKFWGWQCNWGKNATGWIVYSPDGQMKVAIKAENSIFPSIAGLVFNNVLAYGGNYEVQGGLVIHHLDYSSQKSWIGKDQVRAVVQLDKENLVLQGGSKNASVHLSLDKG